jgi:osmotically-inducible protein OsmY
MKSDEQLRTDVMSELQWNPRIRSRQIGVIVKDGAVTLTGMVETLADRRAAELAAKSVKGVRAVKRACSSPDTHPNTFGS